MDIHITQRIPDFEFVMWTFLANKLDAFKVNLHPPREKIRELFISQVLAALVLDGGQRHFFVHYVAFGVGIENSELIDCFCERWRNLPRYFFKLLPCDEVGLPTSH